MQKNYYLKNINTVDTKQKNYKIRKKLLLKKRIYSIYAKNHYLKNINTVYTQQKITKICQKLLLKNIFNFVYIITNCAKKSLLKKHNQHSINSLTSTL